MHPGGHSRLCFLRAQQAVLLKGFCMVLSIIACMACCCECLLRCMAVGEEHDNVPISLNRICW